MLEDDGLENRKTAYETMYTLLATCLSKLELPTFAERVIGGLKDVNEVKTLALMLLLRLAHVAPAHVTPRLDDIVPTLEDMMKNLDIKDDMIKKEIERKGE